MITVSCRGRGLSSSSFQRQKVKRAKGIICDLYDSVFDSFPFEDLVFEVILHDTSLSDGCVRKALWQLIDEQYLVHIIDYMLQRVRA